MAEPDYVYIPEAELEGFVTRIFTASGCTPTEAARISNHLVGANLAGHDSHGVVRVPRYVEWQKAGYVLAGQTVDVITDGGSFVLLDGKFGFGQTVAQQLALDLCNLTHWNGAVFIHGLQGIVGLGDAKQSDGANGDQ